jgi:hypothetical protein
MKTLLLAAAPVALALLLGGCVTTEEMAAQNAKADDGDCRSYGAEVGSTAYFQCRMNKDQTRTYVQAVQRQQAMQNFNRGLNMMAAGLSGAPTVYVSGF